MDFELWWQNKKNSKQIMQDTDSQIETITFSSSHGPALNFLLTEIDRLPVRFVLFFSNVFLMIIFILLGSQNSSGFTTKIFNASYVS